MFEIVWWPIPATHWRLLHNKMLWLIMAFEDECGN